jgi:hypothetical protein
MTEEKSRCLRSPGRINAGPSTVPTARDRLPRSHSNVNAGLNTPIQQPQPSAAADCTPAGQRDRPTAPSSLRSSPQGQTGTRQPDLPRPLDLRHPANQSPDRNSAAHDNRHLTLSSLSSLPQGRPRRPNPRRPGLLTRATLSTAGAEAGPSPHPTSPRPTARADRHPGRRLPKIWSPCSYQWLLVSVRDISTP